MMGQSPWRAYFGQMQKKPSKQNAVTRHPVVVALSVISVFFFLAAALGFRFNTFFFGTVPVQDTGICNDPNYMIKRVRPVLPIDGWVAYLIAFLDPPILVLIIEIIVLIVSLDKHEPESEPADESKPRPLKGPMLFFFRLLHFVAVHLLTLAFVSILVDLAKIVSNWPRPYFVVEFNWACVNDWNPDRSLSREEIYARLGFPSHRVALMTAAAVLLGVHAVRALKNLRSSGPFQAVIVLVGFLPVIFTAASVVNSHENRPVDAIVGLLIGGASAAYMSNMLPSKTNVGHEEPADTPDGRTSMPSTIEELNSVVPMRAAVSWQRPRSPTGGRITNNRHATPVAGYTARS